jgi:hypothetical protein
MLPTPLPKLTEQRAKDKGIDQARMRLTSLFRKLRPGAKSLREKDYLLDLYASCDSLALHRKPPPIRADMTQSELCRLVERYVHDCQQYLDDTSSILQNHIHTGDGIAVKIGQSPRVSPIFWLRQLNRDRFDTLTEAWKVVVIQYGLSLTQLQRARRLLAVSLHPHEFAEELYNRGHQNWKPMEFPETLLLEAESGLLVREVQEEIAKRMRCPPKQANSVMQFNMGKGKSSVVIPTIAAYLAQGDL